MIGTAEALHVIAKAPGASEKTTGDLRSTAADLEQQADRKDRLTVSRSQSNRRNGRLLAAKREADELHFYARLCRVAADEVERRGCRTVGEAVRHPLIRAARKVFGRRG